MRKDIITMKNPIWLRSFIASIVIALLIFMPVNAANIWMSVDPGNQTVVSQAQWLTYEGKEPGCPETDLKYEVYFGDSYYGYVLNVHACVGYLNVHTFSSTGTYTQYWYVGQGSGSWIYLLYSTVHRS